MTGVFAVKTRLGKLKAFGDFRPIDHIPDGF